MKSSFSGDPVENHTKHNGKRNTNLTMKRFTGLQTEYVDCKGEERTIAHNYHESSIMCSICGEILLTINSIMTMLVV